MKNQSCYKKFISTKVQSISFKFTHKKKTNKQINVPHTCSKKKKEIKKVKKKLCVRSSYYSSLNYK